MTRVHDLNFSVACDEVSAQPQHVTLEASAEDLHTLKERFDLLAADRLSARLTVCEKPRENGILIEGRLTADIVQRCVITLGPVADHIDEEFELLLVDEETADAMDAQEVYLDPDARDYDVLEGARIPLGEIVAQTLSILMEDYPRAEGAEITATKGVEVNAPERQNPFAALKDLKD